MKRMICGSVGAVLLASILCAQGWRGIAAEENGSAAPTKAACPAPAPGFADPLSAPHWNGWGVGLSQHRFQPADMAQLAASEVPRLKLKWAFGIPGASRAYAQPTIMGGRIFFGSQGEKVYSLDASTGCTYWEIEAGAPVRAADRHRRERNRLARLFRRCACLRSCRGRRHREGAVDEAYRRACGGAHHRRAAPCRHHAVRAGVVDRRVQSHGPALSLLHLPRQRRRPGCGDRKAAVEIPHDRAGAESGRDEQRRRPVERTLGRRGLVGADLRRQERHDLCDDRRQLLGPADRDVGCRPGVQRRVREFGVVAADDDRRRLQHGLQRDGGGELSAKQGA